jgi:hypothetical protein
MIKGFKKYRQEPKNVDNKGQKLMQENRQKLQDQTAVTVGYGFHKKTAVTVSVRFP